MITITIDNSTSDIKGLDVTQFTSLREVLSYEVNAQTTYFSGKGYKTKRSLLDKRGTFPTGLLHRVENHLKKSNIIYTLKDHRTCPKAQESIFTLSLVHSPYPDQINAVKACIERGRGFIQMPTGTGKSITMALLVHALQRRTLIVVPTLELKRQLRQTFTELFGSLNNITIENIGSPSLERQMLYDVLIIDEAHHSAAKTYRSLNRKQWSGIYYRYCFSATPFRSQDEEQLLMESVTGEVIYSLSHQTAVEKGYIVPIEAYYVELPKKHVEGYTWKEVYKELIVENDYRNQIIAKMLIELHKNKISTLCLVKEIAHGETLARLSGGAFASGADTEDCKQLISWFNEGKLTTLIGTTGVLGEGVDTRPAEFVIVAGLGKSKPAFMQQCGRGFRRYGNKESCKVVIFFDKSHKWTRAHFKAQCLVLLDEYGIKPSKLSLYLKA